MGRGGQRLLFAFAAMALCLQAAAAAAQEDLSSRGGVRFDGAASLDGHVRAFLATFARSEDLLSLRVEAPYVRVRSFELASIEGVGGQIHPLEETERSWDLHDVVITMGPGNQTGFLGYYPDHATASLASADMALAAAVSPHVSTHDLGASRDVPNRPWYHREANGTHSVATGSGGVRIEGMGALKVAGPVLRYEARENDTVNDTGDMLAPGARVGVTRWHYIELRDATILLTTAAPYEAILRGESRVAWDGRANLGDAVGEAVVGGVRYVAAGRDSVLDGSLSATVRAEPDRLVLSGLSGDVRGTDLRAETARAPSAGAAGGAPVPFILVGVAAGVGAVATLGVYVRQRRGREEDRLLTLDQCIDNAELAAEAGRVERAAEWYGRARALAPENPTLAMEHAWFLGLAGERAAALAAYLDASRLTTDGAADLEASRLAALEGDAELLRKLLSRALERSPELVADVRQDLETYRFAWDEGWFADLLADADIRSRVPR